MATVCDIWPEGRTNQIAYRTKSPSLPLGVATQASASCPSCPEVALDCVLRTSHHYTLFVCQVNLQDLLSFDINKQATTMDLGGPGSSKKKTEVALCKLNPRSLSSPFTSFTCHHCLFPLFSFLLPSYLRSGMCCYFSFFHLY